MKGRMDDPDYVYAEPTKGHLPAARSDAAPVRVTGVDISIFDLMVLQVKIAIAAVPAVIILMILGTFAFGLIRAVGR